MTVCMSYYCTLIACVCVWLQVNVSIKRLSLNTNIIGPLGMKVLAPALAVGCDIVLCALCCVACFEILKRVTINPLLIAPSEFVLLSEEFDS